MADTFQLKVVTPTGAAYDKAVTSLSAVTQVGEITILPEHCLLLSSLEAGRMIATTPDHDEEIFALDTGFLEAAPDHVNIISEHCVSAGDIDREALSKEAEAVQQQLDSTEQAPAAEALRAQLNWINACLNLVE
jgi:F-type H+-transporting ATPase subunit epsilon